MEVLTPRGLVRYHVLVVIDSVTRRVEIGGITCDPTGAGRAHTMASDLLGKLNVGAIIEELKAGWVSMLS